MCACLQHRGALSRNRVAPDGGLPPAYCVLGLPHRGALSPTWCARVAHPRGPSSLLWCACLQHRGALSRNRCAGVAAPPRGPSSCPLFACLPHTRGHEFAHGVREWAPDGGLPPAYGVLASLTEGALSPHMGCEAVTPRITYFDGSNYWGSLFFRRVSPENLSGGDGDVHPPFDPNRDIRDIEISLWSGREGRGGGGSYCLRRASSETRRNHAGAPPGT
ncbi:hypothetical protein GQ457_08G033490 [Hibiscus cannabinus]